ncbi:alpha/beta fold hydrolase [Streptomyces sp. NPDC017615]|uniref:alpha/beta fold hydrolase n=1 Tax=Streptomyces sp. NPDC017615 TaxID=3365003 RepID=UPI00378FC876
MGHSVGGLLIRAFAARHPDLVAGLVFVDAPHPDQWVRSELQRNGMPWVRQRLLGHFCRALLGVPGNVANVGETALLPAGGGAATTAMLRLPRPWLGAYREARQAETAWSDAARALSSLSPKPVAVVTAGDTVTRDPARLGLQRKLLELSSCHRHDVVDEASHESVVMHESHASAVIDALRWASAASLGTSRQEHG